MKKMNKKKNKTNTKIALEEIKQRLHHKLFVMGPFSTFHVGFNLAFSQTSKMYLTHDALKNLDLLPELSQDVKDDGAAKTFREKGFIKFKKFQFEEAHEMFTKSLAKGVPGSSQLALTYGFRSALLFEKKFYEECIMDIDRAFENNCPKKIRAQLQTRKEKAEELKTTSKKPPNYEETPEVSVKDQNPEIKNASKAIHIKYNDKYGRHIVASRQIEIGEILATDTALVKVLTNNKYIHCHYCLKNCYNLIPCESCTQELYCSENCKETAKEKYHKVECKILATINELGFDENVKLSLRLLLIILEQIKNQEPNSENISSTILQMQSHIDERDFDVEVDRCVEIIVIFHLLRNCSEEDEDCKEFLDVIINNDLEEQFMELLEIVYVNKLTVQTFSFDKDLDMLVDCAIGYEIIPLYAALNNSCCPNAILIEHGVNKVLRSIATINPGDQITRNYYFHFAETPKYHRQPMLSKRFCFHCNCIACLKNWPILIYLARPKNNSKIEKTMLNIRKGDIDTVKAVLSKWIPKLKKVENTMPSFEAFQIQEIVKHCFVALGNRKLEF